MNRKVFVVGVGMTRFCKPGSRPEWDYPEMAGEAIQAALKDASVSYESIQQASAGYVYGESTAGQYALYGAGMTGIPIFNVNNNCSTGSSALMLAKQWVEGGLVDCALAVGFEKMSKGSLNLGGGDRKNPLDRHLKMMESAYGVDSTAPLAAQMFGNAGREHMEKYGTTREQFAKVAYKNHKHSVNNPNAQFQTEYSLEQILSSPPVFGPLTKLQCCPTSDGAGAAVLCSEAFVKKHGLADRAVEIVGMAMATDFPRSFEKSCIEMIGAELTRKASQQAFQQAGVGPKDVSVIELHDCFSTNELLSYEALGLCAEGKGGELIDSGAVTYGGKWVVNPSGGLISKGHPLGATGLAQCTELVWQLRGQAGKRQVEGARYALQHNLGLGGAAVVTVYMSRK